MSRAELSLAHSSDMTGLRVEHLRKSYRKKVVIRDVSLSLDRGEVVALLGPNGSGKTTTFYAIAGLIHPEGGHIRIDGREVVALPMYRRARLGIGYLPQEMSIFRGLSAEDNIMAILARAGASGSSSCCRNSRSSTCAARPRWRCRAASGGGSRSRAASRPTRATCCSTSPSRGSIRSRWAISVTSWPT
jgi:ABC-type branched-subunit amino acid transport system ATPase component